MPKERLCQILTLYDDWNWNNRHRLFYNLKCRRIYRAQCNPETRRSPSYGLNLSGGVGGGEIVADSFFSHPKQKRFIFFVNYLTLI